jgi:tetratricopeptide (TPR) repeat protein
MRCLIASCLGIVLGALPASCDTVSGSLAAGDSYLARAEYDSAAAAYEPALRDLEANRRWADLKYLLRKLSDQFYAANARHQPKRNVTRAHATYVKLCGHAGQLFTRYCKLVADTDPNPDEKLATIGDQLLGQADFRGGLAHEAAARRFPRSPRAGRSLYQAGAAFHARGLHRNPDASRATAQSMLKEVLSSYPESDACDDALHRLGFMETERYLFLSGIITRWKSVLAQSQAPDAAAARREQAALERKFNSLVEVEQQVADAWSRAVDLFSRAVSDYPLGDMTPYCLHERANLRMLKGDREAARRDWLLLRSRYPRDRRLADWALRKH